MSEKKPLRASKNSLYSDSFVADLMDDFEIPYDKMERLKSVLDKAATIYFLSRRTPSLTEQLISIRRALESVESAVSELKQTLAGLPHPAQDRLWHPLFEDPLRPPDFQGLGEPFGPFDYADEKQFTEVLAAFGKRVHVRLGGLADVKRRGGRPRLTALRNWVGIIADFWANELGRKFTYAEAGGNPKSQAYDFCSRALWPIDHNLSPQQLGTAFRSVVKPWQIKVTVHPSLIVDDNLPAT